MLASLWRMGNGRPVAAGRPLLRRGGKRRRVAALQKRIGNPPLYPLRGGEGGGWWADLDFAVLACGAWQVWSITVLVEAVARLRKSRLSQMPNDIKRKAPSRSTGYALLLAAVILLVICYMQIGPFPPSAFVLLISSGLFFWAGVKMLRHKPN